MIEVIMRVRDGLASATLNWPLPGRKRSRLPEHREPTRNPRRRRRIPLSL